MRALFSLFSGPSAIPCGTFAHCQQHCKSISPPLAILRWFHFLKFVRSYVQTQTHACMFTHVVCGHIMFPIFLVHPLYLLLNCTNFHKYPTQFSWDMIVCYTTPIWAHEHCQSTQETNLNICWKLHKYQTSFGWDIDVC